MRFHYRATPARTTALVALAFVLLGLVAATLSRYYHEARVARAEAHFDRGQMLVRAGAVDRGLVELRASLALNRGNADTALVLATALLDTGNLREAETYLDEAVQADPTSGPANLARARVARALRAGDTDMYYQRAYYGSWGQAVIAQRVGVGFELVEYLLGQGDRDRAKGVLTQLAVDAGNDVDVRLRVAQLQIDAGVPADALPMLRDIVARRPGDAPAWNALANAAFALFEDQIAVRAAAQALNLDKTDQQAERIRRISSAALAIDPRAGRLATRERIRRARELVAMAAEAFDRCQPEAATTPPSDPLRAEAARAIDPRAKVDLDLDELVDLATRLWEARRERCPAIERELEPLGRAFDRLAAGAAR